MEDKANKIGVGKQEKGFSFLELLVTLSISGILVATAVSNLKTLENPLADASFQSTQFLKLVRSRAISRTLTLKVAPSSSTKLVVTSGSSCAAATTAVSDLVLNLPTGATFSATNWSICFTPRGLSTSNTSFNLSESTSTKIRTEEVAIG